MDNLIADLIGDAALVLAVSSLLGALARRWGQPTVIGQILAGILLGPSVLGRLPGHLTTRLFPPAVLPYLNAVAQIAVAIFMFVVGYELNRGYFRRTYRPAIMVAAGALIVPMILGTGLPFVYRSGFRALGQPDLSRSFVLFMGVAISITALPVLAAIMRERGIAGTTAGITAAIAAGIMDVTAWIVLAATLVGTTGGQSRSWPVVLMLVIGFALIMLTAVRPALRWWIRRADAALASQLTVALVLTLGSAWVTASLGLHPVFGGLLAGLTMPGKDGIPDPDLRRLAANVSGVLLPLFFVVTGLSVNVAALNGTAFVMLAVLLALAAAGKVGPAYLAARAGRLGRRDGMTVALLVNTRGLTELIALNIGLSTGLIGPRLFSVLVLMAVLTTVMTAPLLRLAGSPAPAETARPVALEPAPADGGRASRGGYGSRLRPDLGPLWHALTSREELGKTMPMVSQSLTSITDPSQYLWFRPWPRLREASAGRSGLDPPS